MGLIYETKKCELNNLFRINYALIRHEALLRLSVDLFLYGCAAWGLAQSSGNRTAMSHRALASHSCHPALLPFDQGEGG